MTEGGDSATGRGHLPHLDGLRAGAVYLVVAFHAGLSAADGGFIGVDVFFVLSGFLVTGVLLRDVDDDGRVGLWRFYARRMRRLLPAAAANLLVTAVVFSAIASPAEVDDATSSMQAAALYVSNWWFIAESADYFGSTVEASPVLHYWSLSVEEQYYLLWPLALMGVLALARGSRRRAVALVVAAGVASAVAALWIARTDLSRAYYGTDTRAYQLLAGASLALVPAAVRRVQEHRLARRALPAVAVVALGALVVLASSVVDLAPVSRGVAATVLALALLVSAGAPGPVRWLLSTPPAVYLGRISYGTYLWHWLVVVVAGREADLSARSTFALTVLLASGLAALSHAVLEQPIRTAPRLDRVPRPVVAAGLAVSLLVGLVAVPVLLDRVGTAQRGPELAEGGTPVPASVVAILESESDPTGGCDVDTAELCEVHDGQGPRVLLAGDSHAGMLVPALREVAEAHDLDAAAVPMRYCPWVRDMQYLWPDPERCYGMQAVLLDEVVPAYDPDLVILVHSQIDDPADPATIMVRGQGQLPYEPGREDVVEAQVRATVDALRADGRKVLLIEPIPIGTPPVDNRCLLGADFVEACRQIASVGPFPQEELFRRLDAEDDGVWSLDLDRAICPYLPICDPIVGGAPVRLDNAHLSAAFAATLAGPIDEFLAANGVLEASGGG